MHSNFEIMWSKKKRINIASFVNVRVRWVTQRCDNTLMLRSVRTSLFLWTIPRWILCLIAVHTHTDTRTHTHPVDQSLSPVSTARRTSLYLCNVPDKNPTLFFWDKCGTFDSLAPALQSVNSQNSLCLWGICHSDNRVAMWWQRCRSSQKGLWFVLHFSPLYLYKHLNQKHLKHHRLC